MTIKINWYENHINIEFQSIKLVHEFVPLFQLHALIQINGNSGDLKGPKLVKKLTLEIIDKTLLSDYTWSGRAAPNEQGKYAMKDLPLLVRLIYETLRAADSSYAKRQFDDDFVTKVMKVAYKGKQKQNAR